jgi:hypothetical protein
MICSMDEEEREREVRDRDREGDRQTDIDTERQGLRERERELTFKRESESFEAYIRFSNLISLSNIDLMSKRGAQVEKKRPVDVAAIVHLLHRCNDMLEEIGERMLVHLSSDLNPIE